MNNKYGKTYCYNCGAYYNEDKHKCDPKRVVRHYAGMEGAKKRTDDPIERKPTFAQQLADGFKMLDSYGR